MATLRVLGIDPGSVVTGAAVLEFSRGQPRCLHLQSIRLGREQSFPQRLGAIFEAVTALIEEYAPSEFAIEQVFMYRSPESSLKLGQARGVAIAAAVVRNLPVAEYMPAVIKQAVVGTGRADKTQVQHMVRQLMNLSEAPPPDGADAAAVALCHCYRRTSLAGAALDGQAAGSEAVRLLAQSRYRRRSR
ncbi:MAG: crossover junction endodeoxyribonuclease RuvC [Halothiobacillaceae bacterium]